MATYKSIKITFDIEDDHHLKLYNYVKSRSNGSSFLRTLIHQDMHTNTKVSSNIEYEVVKEQVEPNPPPPLKINCYQASDTIEEEDDSFFIDDLI